MEHTNTTTRAMYLVAVQRLEAQLEAGKELPDYAIALIVLVCFLFVCVALQGVALLILTPCYLGWQKFKRIDEEHAAYEREMTERPPEVQETMESGDVRTSENAGSERVIA